jgi:hypothetical protein
MKPEPLAGFRLFLSAFSAMPALGSNICLCFHKFPWCKVFLRTLSLRGFLYDDGSSCALWTGKFPDPDAKCVYGSAINTLIYQQALELILIFGHARHSQIYRVREINAQV